MRHLLSFKGVSRFQVICFDENYNPPSSPFGKGGIILPPFGEACLPVGRGGWEGFFIKMYHYKDLFKKLLHIEDTPERTALAYSIGIFLGFSPFLGFHTLAGLAVAFLFNLNRVAILLGVWSNTPWWIVPYYTGATWVGMWVTGFQIDKATVKAIFQLEMDQEFMSSDFWSRVASQWGLLFSFMMGSLIFATLLSFVAYPLSLRWIKFYRSRRK
jgi:uncharacterized protein (DUF2062 family)